MTEKILQLIDAALNSVKPPLAPIPASVLLVGSIDRPGLTSTDITANIISRKSEAGISTEADIDNSVTNSMELIRVQEILKALQTNAKIEIVIPSGVPIQATGANAGGPVTVIGTTILPAVGYGIIR